MFSKQVKVLGSEGLGFGTGLGNEKHEGRGQDGALSPQPSPQAS